MGKRGRRREAPVEPAARNGKSVTTRAPREPRLRGEARNEAIRRDLDPLEPDERPTALVVAVVVAAALGAANVGLLAAGVEFRGSKPAPVGAIAFGALMFVAAWGMWRKHYWAVLGFQALLALSVLIAGLSLAVASNLAAVALCLAIMVPGGWLFWKLVRVLARLQMPERRPAR